MYSLLPDNQVILRGLAIKGFISIIWEFCPLFLIVLFNLILLTILNAIFALAFLSLELHALHELIELSCYSWIFLLVLILVIQLVFQLLVLLWCEVFRNKQVHCFV